MGQDLLVERHLNDGERLLKQLRQDGYPYLAAAWFHEDTTDQWYLYVVTALVDSGGRFQAYSRLNETHEKLQDLAVDSSDFRVFSPSSRVALGLKPYIARLGKSQLPTLCRHIDFDHSLSGDAWVYPRSMQPAFDEWSREMNVEKVAVPQSAPVFQSSP